MRNHDDVGFGLVEVVIAMLLLGLIAVAMIPALWNGVRFSTEQSAVATATRQVNTLIEQGRQVPTCSNLQTLAAYNSGWVDGSGIPYQTQGSRGICAAAGGQVVSLEIWATQSGRELVRVKALIYVPKVSP